ncbi:hypothetical protein M2322_002344 [Rhodoblastus acidophilus]|nr:hypothetical protein [Rhodoblastus acidophilus]
MTQTSELNFAEEPSAGRLQKQGGGGNEPGKSVARPF